MSPMVSHLVSLISQVARRTGLRERVRRSPRVEAVWTSVRALILNEDPPAPAPAPAVKEQTGVVPKLVPHRFRALLAQRHQLDIDAETDPLKRLYLDFALSTVRRAETIRDFVAARTPITGKRYLDVGCAYGGFLVAFHQAGAAKVVGFDYDASLLDYARALLDDYSVPAVVRHDSILDAATLERFGQFDIITCNDVLEHVTDARMALTNLAALLAPGGLLYLEIPNRFAASFVLSDGHFMKFGLTSLPKPLADARFTEEEGRVHDVTYKSFDWYVNTLQRMGLEVLIENPLPDDLPASFARIGATFEEVIRVADGSTFSGAKREETAAYARRAARQFQRLHARWRDDPSGKHRTTVSARRLQFTYGEEFWRITVRRPLSRAP